MRRRQSWVVFSLLSIIIISIILRLIKLYEFTIWGSDSGEHFFLLNQLTELNYISYDYNGWGFAYPYFPGMHLLSTAFSEMSGIHVFTILTILIPAISALSVILIYSISVCLFRDPRAGLIAAAFLGVVLPHVYSSSHPMPGSLGGFLLLSCLFLLIKTYDNKKFMIPLLLTSLALVITHHLTIYFLIIALVAIILFRCIFQNYNIKKNNGQDTAMIDILYLTFLISIALIYWFAFAPPFIERILSKVFPTYVWLIIPLAYLSILILWLIVYLRKKATWNFKPKIYSAKKLMLRVILFQLCGVIIIFISVITGVPGTDMDIEFTAVLIFLPIIILMSFISITPAIIGYFKHGYMIIAWLIAIVVSILFAFVTKSQELLLYRHLPYAFEPISILAGLGFAKLFDMLNYRNDSRIIYWEPNRELIKPTHILSINDIITGLKMDINTISSKKNEIKIRLKAKYYAVSIILILILICSIFSYPPLEVVSGFQEGTTDHELESCIWARENLPSESTIASDHRISSMIFGFANLNSSWEYTPNIFHGENMSEFESELIKASLPSGKKRINYILLTEPIKNGVALKQWENAMPMSENAIKKFESEPFIKIFDNGEAELYYNLN